MMQSTKTLITVLILLTVAVLLPAGRALAADVTGTLVKKSGPQLVAAIHIMSPVPGSLIFKVKVPGGNDLVSATPAPDSFKAETGVVKFMFKKMAVGSHQLVLNFREPIAAGSARGEILYRDASGEMQSVEVK